MTEVHKEAEAYVLIVTKGGDATKVADEISKLNGFRFRDMITGYYDIVAVVNLRDASYLGLLRETCQEIHGVEQLEAGLVTETKRDMLPPRGHAWFHRRNFWLSELSAQVSTDMRSSQHESRKIAHYQESAYN